MNFFLLLYLMFSVNLYAADYEIVDYVASRDRDAVISMLAYDKEYLAFENIDLITHYIDNIEPIDNNCFKVMRQNEQTIAFVEYLHKKKSWWVIRLIVVDHNYRRCGYATAMLQFSIDAIKLLGADRISLAVKQANIVARTLYEEKFGFKKYAERLDAGNLFLVIYPR